jgi:hypothetical protein
MEQSIETRKLSKEKQALAGLARAHENKGAPYPRPRETCDSCKADIILCWGHKRTIHWKHVKSTGRLHCSSANGESATHKRAKELLVDFLNAGKTIWFRHNCTRCDHAYVCRTPFSAWKQEVKHVFNDESCIFDVGGLNDADLVFGIEVEHKHKTSNVTARKAVQWVEVKASDVLNELYSDNDRKMSITLKNYHVTLPCSVNCLLCMNCTRPSYGPYCFMCRNV